jgi:hypothetical protein
MKVFMSWSGDRSREVANLLTYWIKCVVQASRPWISTSGIDSGSIWFNQINNELQDTTFGIICITKENKDAPWILFEAGALAKGLASSRVCTFLIDLETKDIRDPLAQFNHTLPTFDSMWKLVSTLNGSLPEVSRLDAAILKGVFETYWKQFDEKFKLILETYPETTVVPPRKQEDILDELLNGMRGLERRIRNMERPDGLKYDTASLWDHAKSSSWTKLFSFIDDEGKRSRVSLTWNEIATQILALRSKDISHPDIAAFLGAKFGLNPKQAEELILRALQEAAPTPPPPDDDDSTHNPHRVD